MRTLSFFSGQLQVSVSFAGCTSEKSGLYHGPLSPSRKLMTRLEECLRESDALFRCNSSLSSLLKVFHSFLASISLSGIIIPDSFMWCFEMY